jgi:hypothetical protein
MPLLYLDLLGVRARWLQGGRPEAENAFAQLEEIVVAALSTAETTAIREAVVETDAAAIVFAETTPAIEAARRAFQLAFFSSKQKSGTRLWLRGALVPFEVGGVLRRTTPAGNSAHSLQRVEYSGALLDAVSLEKSGLKGMRFIIDDTLLTQGVQKRSRIPIGRLNFVPFRRLNNSPYPVRIAAGYQDLLWMAPRPGEDWDAAKLQMASRLRWAASNAEEFLQAAATQVVFHECAAMVSSLMYRDHKRKSDSPPAAS